MMKPASQAAVKQIRHPEIHQFLDDVAVLRMRVMMFVVPEFAVRPQIGSTPNRAGERFCASKLGLPFCIKGVDALPARITEPMTSGWLDRDVAVPPGRRRYFSCKRIISKFSARLVSDLEDDLQAEVMSGLTVPGQHKDWI
jgi:hypothetical protein